MKREEIRTAIPGITNEQLDWLMRENGKDINNAKKKALDAQIQMDGLRERLKVRLARLQKELQEQADALAFDAALSSAHTAFDDMGRMDATNEKERAFKQPQKLEDRNEHDNHQGAV